MPGQYSPQMAPLKSPRMPKNRSQMDITPEEAKVRAGQAPGTPGTTAMRPGSQTRSRRAPDAERG